MWLFSDKVLVRESGLLEGFCDCHCHLLPGVDDGVGEANEALQILHEWETAGIKEVWMTPHIMEDFPNEPEELRSRFAAFQKLYDGTITLHLAAEHMMDGLFLKRLEADNVLPIGHEGRRLLVETSYYIPPMNMEVIIDQIKHRGYEPILAHPERYQYMDRHDYLYWKQKGMLFQLNLPSLVGAYGPEVLQKAEWLLRENMYDYCGSDTHALDQVELFMESTVRKKTVKKVIKTLLRTQNVNKV